MYKTILVRGPLPTKEFNDDTENRQRHRVSALCELHGAQAEKLGPGVFKIDASSYYQKG